MTLLSRACVSRY